MKYEVGQTLYQIMAYEGFILIKEWEIVAVGPKTVSVVIKDNSTMQNMKHQLVKRWPKTDLEVIGNFSVVNNAVTFTTHELTMGKLEEVYYKLMYNHQSKINQYMTYSKNLEHRFVELNTELFSKGEVNEEV